MREILAVLLAGRDLSREEAERAFRLVLAGEANEAQVGSMLALLQVKGVSLDELVGGARVMRAYATPVPVADAHRERMIDTCGTGGAPKTFNISTAVAIVAAAAEGPGGERVRVAKHGGKSRTGRGSAEVLARLGVNVDASPAVEAACLEEAGVCFCFAIHHHPAMKFAAGPRKSLGFPTVFNLLGPLTNPAGAQRQLLGVYDPTKVELVARALVALGAEEAMVVHGADGMDELTTTAETVVARVRGGDVVMERVMPEDAGLGRTTLDALRVGTVEEAAELIRRVLGGEHGPARDIVLLNAAAALVVGGVADDLRAGVDLAARAVDGGAAAGVLERLVEVSQR